MTPGLLEELVNAESIWRSITLSQQPLFADMPVEHVDPDPTNKRHWMFATDNRKIMAHIYKPEEVQRRFEEVIVPLFHDAYGFSLDPKDTKECATQLIQDTCTYLLFHELFHPVYCPKSKSDKEKFDVGLKNGIKKGDKGISDRDLVNKVGNVRNAMWDLLIDTFFTYYSRSGSGYDRGLRKEMSQRGYALNNHLLESLPDGIVTTWDITELVDHDPDTLFYPITRAIYGFLNCYY